jgi:hypothetical protein
MAVPVVAMLAIERLKVELVDHVEDEPGEVAIGQPVAQVRGQQEGLVAVTAQEVVSHRLFYYFAVIRTKCVDTSQAVAQRTRLHVADGPQRPGDQTATSQVSMAVGLRSMVRRGSTVRVRQRALQKPRKRGFFLSDAVAQSSACGGYGAVYGALTLRCARSNRIDSEFRAVEVDQKASQLLAATGQELDRFVAHGREVGR